MKIFIGLLLSLTVFISCDTSDMLSAGNPLPASPQCSVTLLIDQDKEQYFSCQDITAYRIKDSMCSIAFGDISQSYEKRYTFTFNVAEFKTDSFYSQLPGLITLRPGYRVYHAVISMYIKRVDSFLVDGYIEAVPEFNTEMQTVKIYYDGLRLNM